MSVHEHTTFPFSRSPRIDLTGQRFGRLVAVCYMSGTKEHPAVWECLCDCSNKKYATAGRLRDGSIKSCGCLLNEICSGKSNYKEYSTWEGMIARCYNINNIKYPLYGGRGITVCDPWRNSFMSFYNDIGPKPSRKYSLDRIDNDGNYEPSNCRWATIFTQNTNKRNTHFVTAFNETRSLAEWAILTGICFNTLWGRIVIRKLSPEDALTAPLIRSGRPPKGISPL